MKILFLIGNGFDLNLGLKTSYKDFYKFYIEVESPNSVVETFKKELSENIDNWADLEMCLGQYTDRFKDDEDDKFVLLLDDIQDKLAEYLESVNTDVVISNETIESMGKDLFFLDRHLSEKNKKILNSFKARFNSTNYSANIISFNYTNSFEKIFSYKNTSLPINKRSYQGYAYQNTINRVIHIHGTTEDNMILGVNDVSQIENVSFKTNKKIIRSLVKPELNKNTETLRDFDVEELIKQSDIICIYGMSLGQTDNFWWHAIAEQLKLSKKLLIIYTRSSDIVKRRAYKSIDIQEKVKDRILSTIEVKDDEKEEILNKIIVSLNSKMFSTDN